MDPEIRALFEGLIEAQKISDRSVGKLAQTVEHLAGTVDRLAGTVDSLAGTVGVFVASSDARLKRLEENLDGLIRAITQEHTNGKGKIP